MKRKNLFPAFFALAVFCAGCQQTPPSEKTKLPESEAESNAGSETELPESEAGSNAGAETELIWRIDVPMDSDYYETAQDLANIWQNPLNKQLESKGADYTVRIVPIKKSIPSEASSVSDELAQLKEDGEQTDLISILPAAINGGQLDGYRPAYVDCAKKGLLMSLESFLSTEKGSTLLESVTETDLEQSRLNGTAYGISAVLPVINATVYSKEQMEKYGVKEEDLKSAVFENEGLFQKIKEQSGMAPYGISSGDIRLNLGLYIVSPCNNLALNTDGEFVNITETREFRNYLKHLADWKEKGLVELTDYAVTPKRMHFAQDTSLTGQNYADQPYSMTLGMGEETADVFVLPDETSPVIEPYWGDNKLCIASWTKNRKEAEDFLMRLMTDPDLSNLVQYGRDQRDYILDGTAVHVYAQSNVLLRIFGYQYANPLITFPTATMAKEKIAYAKRHHDAYGKEVPYGFRFDPSPVLEEIEETNKVFSDMGGSETAEKIFQLEIKDADQVITEITEELKAAGIDRVAEEANRQLKAWKKENE